MVLLLVFSLLTQRAAAPAAKGAVIQGIVARAGSGEPIARAVVQIRRDGDPSQPITAATEDDGRFLVPGVPAGRYALTISRSGYVTRQVDVVVTAGQPGPMIAIS